MIEVIKEICIAFFNNSFGEYCFVLILSETSLLIVMFSPMHEILMNNIMVGKDIIYKVIPEEPKILVIKIRLIKPRALMTKPVIKIIRVLKKKEVLSKCNFLVITAP